MGSNHALRRGTAVLAAALTFAVVQPAVSAQAATVFTFEGGGYGHSVGMSQFGAYGMALGYNDKGEPRSGTLDMGRDKICFPSSPELKAIARHLRAGIVGMLTRMRLPLQLRPPSEG